jgi:hypothetical protein
MGLFKGLRESSGGGEEELEQPVEKGDLLGHGKSSEK